jgi:beta-lactam-binding protein with PASTA domain
LYPEILMKHFFRLALSILVMLAVIVFSALITLRLALHGGEVAIPDFASMTVAEASNAALHAGLDLNIENKFYSTTIPAGRILSQAPAAGSKVRHGWEVRVTQSLGPQQVTIPDVAGDTQRVASIELRQNSLDLGTIAHMDAPGDPDMVLAQSPPPNAGVDQPRVSLLLSSPAGGADNSYVMPSFTGMSYAAATRLANDMGLHVSLGGDIPQAPPPPQPPVGVTPSGQPIPAGATPAQAAHLDENGQAVAVPVTPAGPPPPPSGPVSGQTPESGSRIARGDAVKLIFGHSAPAAPATP